MGCLPSAKAVNPSNTSACFQALNDLTNLHNKALSEVLQKLANELDGFKYSLADAYTALSDKINNPSKYGMTEPFSLYTLYYIILTINLFVISIIN